MERERTLVNLEQEPKEDPPGTPDDIHAGLMTNLHKAIVEETLTSIKKVFSESAKLGSTDVNGIGNFALLWDAMLKNGLIAIGKYSALQEIFVELKLTELSDMVQEASDQIDKIKSEQEARQNTPEEEKICSACQYEDEEKITAAEYTCTKCEKVIYLCPDCATTHGQGLGHTDFIKKMQGRRNQEVSVPKTTEVPIEELLQIPDIYYKIKQFDKAKFLFQLIFPAKPKCHFAHSVAVSRDMGIWRHLVLARCFGELGGPAETLMAFAYDGKCVYVNSKETAHNSCHMILYRGKEFLLLRQDEPYIRITDTAAKAVLHNTYLQKHLQRPWTVDACGKVIYIMFSEGQTDPTKCVVLDNTGKIRTTIPTGKKGFVACERWRPRVLVFSNTSIAVYDWRNERLLEVESGEHGLQKFDIWDVCSQDEVVVCGLSTNGEAPWEVCVYQMTTDNSGSWTLRRIQLLQDGDDKTVRSFCSPKISYCQSRLMLGYKFPIEVYRVDIFEVVMVEERRP